MKRNFLDAQINIREFFRQEHRRRRRRRISRSLILDRSVSRRAFCKTKKGSIFGRLFVNRAPIVRRPAVPPPLGTVSEIFQRVRACVRLLRLLRLLPHENAVSFSLLNLGRRHRVDRHGVTTGSPGRTHTRARSRVKEPTATEP